jgi:hypothetical protein
VWTTVNSAEEYKKKRIMLIPYLKSVYSEYKRIIQNFMFAFAEGGVCSRLLVQDVIFSNDKDFGYATKSKDGEIKYPGQRYGITTAFFAIDSSLINHLENVTRATLPFMTDLASFQEREGFTVPEDKDWPIREGKQYTWVKVALTGNPDLGIKWINTDPKGAREEIVNYKATFIAHPKESIVGTARIMLRITQATGGSVNTAPTIQLTCDQFQAKETIEVVVPQMSSGVGGYDKKTKTSTSLAERMKKAEKAAAKHEAERAKGEASKVRKKQTDETRKRK